MILVIVAVQTTVCSVSLMPPTAAVVLRGLYQESGSFPMEMCFLLLLISFCMVAMALASAETEDRVLHVYFDSTIHHKEDVSDVNCWGTPSMSTSVS